MADLMKSFLFLLVYCLSTIEGEIRCYCNESGCVSTGYMCKSQLGTCYLQVTYSETDAMPAFVHGCADKLAESILRTCTNSVVADNENPSQNISENSVESGSDLYKVEITESNVNNIVDNSVDPSQEQTITCCSNDMCNYRDSMDISIVIDTQSNDSAKRGNKGYLGTSSENKGFASKNQVENPQKDLWFKAAVIAVPIAGGFILVLLVLLAVRMLRTDSRYHRRLIQIRRERSLTKAQLYVTDHFIDKSDKQNKLYSENHCHNNISPPKCTVSNGHRYERVDTDKNINSCSENIPKVHSHKTPHLPYSSYIVWGKPENKDFATVV